MLEAGMTYTYLVNEPGTLMFDWSIQAEPFPDGTVFNIVSRGSDFSSMPMEWYQFDPELMGTWNTNFIDDPRLLQYARNMRDTTPGDMDTFFEHWLEFVTYINEIAVDVWLYSDLRHTFHRTNLHNFTHSAIYPYTSALVRAWVT
jgi:hypothetical protein